MLIEQFRHTQERPWTYADLDSYQIAVAETLRADENARGRLILSEVAPVVTLGNRMRGQNPQRPRLDSTFSIYECNRGGFETYHGPGQWLLFPVERLACISRNGLSKGAFDLVCKLLKAAQRTALEFGVPSEMGSGDRLGLWTREGKLASVGIRVDRGIVLHGVALNVFKTEESFQGIRPCGLGEPVAYLDKPLEFDRVGAVFAENALGLLG